MRYTFRYVINFIIISSILFGVILFFLADYLSLNIFHNDKLIPFLKVFAISIPFSAILSIYLSGLRAFEEIGWGSFINNIFQSVIKLLALALLIFLGWGSESVVISYLATAVLSLILAYYICRRYAGDLFVAPNLDGKAKKQVISEIISYSWPLIFLGSVTLIFDWADSFIIGYFKTAVDVGFYNVAYSLSTLFVVVPELFMQLFLPLIIKEYAKDNNNAIEEMGKQVGKWILIVNMPLFIVCVIFPGAIINILFGNQYLAAENALIFLVIGGFISATFIALCNNILSMKGKSKMILANLVGVSTFNLIMNVILVPRYGISGAAFSTSLTWIVLTLILLIEVKKETSIIPLRKKMLNVVVASIISAVFLVLVRQFITINLINLIFAGILFMICYLLMLYLLKCFDRHDLMIIDSIKIYLYSKKGKVK